MNSRYKFSTFALAILVTFTVTSKPGPLTADETSASKKGNARPNVVWILSEDNSKHYLKLFDKHGAPTPRIAELAKDGLLFEHAFSCAPVCSVARTTLMTSRYAPRIGTQFHRKIAVANLPAGWQMFPAHLRDAGYYTTNNSKTDYNTAGNQRVWDESSKSASYRKRPTPTTPFFHMQTFGTSHESSLHFSTAQMKAGGLKTDPQSVTLAPYHPDTPTFRYTCARYHDRIQDIDTAVGKLVDQLKADGLLENTFIFYFGDHGGVLPGSKGYLQESGLHVPLVVRVPEQYQQLAPFPRGSRVQGFVNFTDFGTTVLNLAGVKVPDTMDGKPFLGNGVTAENVNARDTTFGHADRFDEKYDFCRSVRQGRYKYIRNYHAFYPDGLHNNYRYKMLAYAEWRKLSQQGELNAIQQAFFEAKAPAALYDLEVDPHETKNLIDQPELKAVQQELANTLNAQLRAWPDLSFYPETVLVEQAMNNPVKFGQDHQMEIAKLIGISDFALLPPEQAIEALENALQADDPWQRYTAIVTAGSLGPAAAPLVNAVKPLLNDEKNLVQVRAIEFLAMHHAIEPQQPMLKVLKSAKSPVTNLIALNAVVFLQDHHGYQFSIRAADVSQKNGEVNRRLEYLSGKPAAKPRRKQQP